MFRFPKTLVQRFLASLGWRLVKVGYENPAGFSAAVRRLGERDPRAFNTVIDIGASNGSWSKELMKQFPSANYLLIDAQSIHEPELKKFCAIHKNAQYTLAAAGAERGAIYFDVSDPFGGVASYTPLVSNCVQVPVVTIDEQVRLHDLRPPFLIKLDTHGFEIPILKGAVETLLSTNALVIECYNFKIAPESLLFPKMCEYLSDHGFRPMDLYDVMHRPSDDALWQMDILFMRSQREEFAKTSYS